MANADEPLVTLPTNHYTAGRSTIPSAAVYATGADGWTRSASCGKSEGPYLVTDSSGGEYGCVVLCEACIVKAFGAARESNP